VRATYSRVLIRSLLVCLVAACLACSSTAPPPGERAAISALESHVHSRDFAAWAKAHPSDSARALKSLVDQLGAFDRNVRDKVAALLIATGPAGIDALIGGLSDRRLAVRAAASDTLIRTLTDHHGVAPAAIPRYDAWAPTPERGRMAAAVRAWWQKRRSQPGRTL